MVLHKLSVRCRLALVEEGTGPGCRQGEARCWADTVMVRRVGAPVSAGRRGYREWLHHNWYKTLAYLKVAHYMFYTARMSPPDKMYYVVPPFQLKGMPFDHING